MDDNTKATLILAAATLAAGRMQHSTEGPPASIPKDVSNVLLRECMSLVYEIYAGPWPKKNEVVNVIF